jgi:hypothetical protein
MREALFQFIHAHYIEVLAVLPMTFLLIVYLIAVGIHYIFGPFALDGYIIWFFYQLRDLLKKDARS